MGNCGLISIKQPANNQGAMLNRTTTYIKDSCDTPNEIFYQHEIANEDISSASLKEKIELFIGLRNIKNYYNKSYRCQVSVLNKNSHLKLGSSSEKLGEPNLNFDASFVLDYFFEMKQDLLITIYENNKSHPEIKTSIGNLMGTRNQTLILPLPNEANSQQGKSFEVYIQGNPLKTDKDPMSLTLDFSLSRNVSKQDDLFYIIKRNSSNSEEKPYWISSYKSAVINMGESGSFKTLKIKNRVVCNDNINHKFLLEVYNYKKKELIGSLNLCISQILPTANSPFFVSYLDPNPQILNNSEIYTVNLKASISREFTFLDYIKGGLKLGLIIGIDFTASNKQPSEIDSLHYMGKVNNSYEKAMKSCGDIVAYYDYDQLFPVFGFGAKIGSSFTVNHCFNITLKEDPNIFRIDNILSEYRALLEQKKITLYGPTWFCPLIRKTIEITRKTQECSGEDNYQILMILTDGEINDMPQTIDALVEASYMPISVIIIGIGDADFSNMNVLDADDNPLIDSKGVKAGRDLVQFVPFNSYKNDPEMLSQQVLEEIPRQVVEYYKMSNISPKIPTNTITTCT